MFCAVGAYLSALNAYVAYLSWVVKSPRVPSWTPILGGCLLAAGVFVIPNPHVRKWFWVAFFVDYGCVPGMLHALCWHVWRIVRRGNDG